MRKNKIKKLERLAEKLLKIRLKLGLSQAKMAEALERYGVERHRSSIRAYENGDRLPPPLVALAYARLAKVSLDLLIDDERDLPKGF
ncbi:MAG TPA: helix-turn-helix transcriptional regulator [Pyrinomonadaceae bacterium]|jgi:transcriptional regulator with XRE-family HTH domain|nr:helix-turn-helix transcriptional regulator [Pyrinomonadaceae bacterium]